MFHVPFPGIQRAVPTEQGAKWVKEKWFDPQAILERIKQCCENGGGGKQSMCVISACAPSQHVRAIGTEL